MVVHAFKLIKANAGAAGVDQQSLANFEENLKDNLYKIWNRLSSGSYFPPPVKAVPIPKKSGGERILGIPTVSDRIAQRVVKLIFEPLVEPKFLPDSYGYRPNKSALDAVGITRQRCFNHNWLVEYDIQGLFDNLDHELLMKAVRKHTECKWVILYIERWLRTPIQMPNGSLQKRTKGVPQGGVISPVLSNLYLHYVFDLWMKKQYPSTLWCRYADDGLAHCKTRSQAEQLLVSIEERFKSCGLALHPTKTKIIYCKDDNRKGEYPNTEFEFLGYCFRRRRVENNKTKQRFYGFTPAVSKSAQKSMREKTRRQRVYRMSDLNLHDIADIFNPILRGWINYYGRYHRSELESVLRHFDRTLAAWARRKFKKLRGHRTKATVFLRKIVEREKSLFVHWTTGMVNTFV